jgi:hypothetical protein
MAAISRIERINAITAPFSRHQRFTRLLFDILNRYNLAFLNIKHL